MSKSTLFRVKLCLLGIIGVILMATVNAHAISTVFQETFPFTTPGATQDEELRNQGWCGGNAGDDFCNNPPGTIANQGGEGAISVGNGPDGVQGFAFWSQKAINADSFLYTQKYMPNSSLLTSLSWMRRDSASISDPMHLAFRINNDWYISDQNFASLSNDWVAQTAEMSALTFFQRSGSATVLPGGGVISGGLSLPSDENINAWGFWWDGPKRGTSRLDNVTLMAKSVPEPNTIFLLGLGLIGLVGSRKKKFKN